MKRKAQFITACNATHYGLFCANTCSCNLNNTVDCNDTTGECLCAAGWNGTTCDEDVNECLNDSYCPDYMEVCFNLVGSAECRCEIGFQRSLIDLHCQACNNTFFGYECSNSCSCVMENTVDCLDNTGECSCLFGWKGINCETDIDECKKTDFCSDIHASCFYLNGSAECRCDIGYENSTTDESCQACNATHYGLNCANTCSCNLNNTVDCNDTTGECLCAAGWNGTTCDEDVNECLDASYCHGYMEVCFNLVGSAECRCEIGFQRSLIDLQCQACNNTFFGYECSNLCSCVMENTVDCLDNTGECYCLFGWKGINCETDIDECKKTDFCSDIHASCFYLNGSAECRCNIGYENSTTDESCQELVIRIIVFY
ncbi:multiple epidermal growth factor-like domains protein 10 [Physella acuta]|uniref:multiple epidermal growth factor-like domains protein 10 n=1 Tax=Physella acuta TaxID=109671 RepID=UPI0027DAED74|nr:multiple epidermal growth factor-like domains protein 10 [Physella acuta]